jgi:hypothetical protein
MSQGNQYETYEDLVKLFNNITSAKTSTSQVKELLKNTYGFQDFEADAVLKKVLRDYIEPPKIVLEKFLMKEGDIVCLFYPKNLKAKDEYYKILKTRHNAEGQAQYFVRALYSKEQRNSEDFYGPRGGYDTWLPFTGTRITYNVRIVTEAEKKDLLSNHPYTSIFF